MNRGVFATVLATVIASVALVGRAQASDPARMALLVGNNGGSGARPPLRYAEDDAAKLGRVLVELGGFRALDVQVIAGGSLADVLLAVIELRAKVAGARQQGRHTVVLFYFSGHSDGQSLEVGKDAWQFSDLRRALAGLGAEVRLAIVDSCRSGAFLASKGGVPGPSFDIRFSGDLATTGEAFLTSTAKDEMALESRELRASIFSHHLISGLRGAADTSGDGRVTLGEAYRHAFVNTLLATSGTLAGPQHPAYDYSISGRGELVLTEVGAPGALLDLPSGFERILIADTARRMLLAELTSHSAHRIALPPGQYVVQARRHGRAFEAQVAVSRGQTRALTTAELSATPSGHAATKGADLLVSDESPPRSATPWAASSMVGVVRGAAAALPLVPGLRLAVQTGGRHGLEGHVEIGSARGGGFRESTTRAGLSLFAATTMAGLRLQAGWRVMAGLLVQDLDGQAAHLGWTVGTGPGVSASLALGAHLALIGAAGIDGVVLRRDSARELAFWPAAFLGLELRTGR